MRSRLWFMVLAALLTLGVSGCSSDQPKGDQSFAGHWHSPQWGEHYIAVEGDTAKIVYEHLDGRVIGTIAQSTITGWWTEAPGRQPSASAGDVTFTLSGSGDGRKIHGTWRHGSDGSVRDDWDMVWVDAQIPADVQAKFNDAASFIAHP